MTASGGDVVAVLRPRQVLLKTELEELLRRRKALKQAAQAASKESKKLQKRRARMLKARSSGGFCFRSGVWLRAGCLLC